MTYPSYDPALGPAQLDGESYICNQNLKLSRKEKAALITRAQRRYISTERSTIQFCADLRRLHDTGIHKRGPGPKDFGYWCVETFPGITRTNAKLLCWQGTVLLILEGHGFIDIDAVKPRIGATGVRKLASLLSNFDEQTLVTVWEQIEEDFPDGKIVEADVVIATQNAGIFRLNKDQPESEHDTLGPVPHDDDADDEDEDDIVDDTPSEDFIEADAADVEAIMHLHQELVDSFDKKRVQLIKLTDPDNQPYDSTKIRKLYDEMATLLFELGNMLELEPET
jgi:hypothetical protein